MSLVNSLFRMRPLGRWSRLLVGLALVTAALSFLRPAYAASITVTTTADTLDAATCAAVTPAALPGSDGQTSLREAICAANSNADTDTINFNIAGAGPHVISVGSALPDITAP